MTRRCLPGLGLVAAVLLLGACAAPGIEERSSGEPPWGEVTLVEELRIGQYEGADEYMFGSISHVIQHPDGAIFIADPRVPIIRRYDAEGLYMHDLGGEGQGPGEYTVIMGMKLTPEGNIAVWDPRVRRVSVLTPDGEPIDSFTADSGLHTSSRVTLQVDRDGNFYVLTSYTDPDDIDAARRDAYLKYSPAGELLDTIVMPDTTPEQPRFVLSTASGLLPNFSLANASTISTSGNVVTGHTGTYAFEVRDGDEVLIAGSRAWEPVPLAPEEHALWTDRRDRIMNRPAPEGFVNAPEPPEYADIPVVKPAFMDLWPGEDGTIWVRRYAAAEERTDLPPPDPDDDRPQFTWFQRPTFDVFGSEGEFLGTVVLPHDTRIAWFHADTIWTVQHDEHDEDVAVRYRIDKSRAGS